MNIAVLFARRDSIYKTIPGCDVYDADRDALSFSGTEPVVAHPPCRGWGSLRAFAKPRPGEKELAIWAIGVVRRNGGVLEHPRGSSLWSAARLPRPGEGPDEYGGWTLQVEQFWWGHRAAKATWLYICRVSRSAVPPIPLVFGESPCVVASKLRCGDHLRRPHITKPEREHSPEEFAKWLIELARASTQYS